MKRIHVLPADPVLILGAGPMGLLLVQALQRMGASYVAVVEKQPARLELAKAMGASFAVPAGADQDAALKEIAPRGFGVVIDATGAPAVIEGAFRYLRPRGTYLQFGVAPNHARISVSPYDIFRNDWTIVGSFALCYTFLPAIDWLASGAIDIAPLVSHVAPMHEFASVFQQFAAGQTLKVHVEMQHG
jgi:threonine dehydrogenase-like Zn-dependent dehydrogenase